MVENVGNGGRFLVSKAENVVVKSSLLVEICERYLCIFAARKQCNHEFELHVRQEGC